MSLSAAPEMSSMESKPEVVVLANGHCHKALAIAEKVGELGVKFDIVDIDGPACPAARFGHLFASGSPHAPALVIGDRALRNPAVADVEKLLARNKLVPTRLIDYPEQGRVVWHMHPSDAFASYTTRSDGTLVFGHIETARELRGTGLGARLATELFDWLCETGTDARLNCSFLRKVAASKPEWGQKFLR